eukprot:scaffold7269_cov108-Skeletonema_dohrnii-CCMP3373.AAC.2
MVTFPIQLIRTQARYENKDPINPRHEKSNAIGTVIDIKRLQTVQRIIAWLSAPSRELPSTFRLGRLQEHQQKQSRSVDSSRLKKGKAKL